MSRTRLAAVLLALVSALLVAPPASAAVTHEAVITFHKNYANTFRSRLTWELYEIRCGSRTRVQELSWRAGSGYFRNATNACALNRGWLPDGTYGPRLFRDYHGNLIKGRAIYLGRKACGDGTMRTDLFIHTEQGAGSRQCADRRGDQVCRWEYPKINDYRSYGCVKLSPGDLRELYDAWRRWFPLGTTDRVRVVVR